MNTSDNAALEKLLQRSDIWRGRSAPVCNQTTLDSGFAPLNTQLLNQGWPCGSLIEICQPAPGHGDWLLLAPALQRLQQRHPQSHTVLLNPPALPFCQGLIPAGIPFSQLLLIRINTKADFVASFVELARASSCTLLVAWQPKQALNYSELRKCQLATAEGAGLYVLFRPLQALQQSSPAALRLQIQLEHSNLRILFIKQRGQLYQSEAVNLPLPKHWLAATPHRMLGHPQTATNESLFTGYQPRQNLIPLGVRKGVTQRVHRKRAY